MNRLTISKALFYMTGLGSIIMGLIYMNVNTPMPYHLEALAGGWQTLDAKQSLIMMIFLRGAGSGFVCIGLATLAITRFAIKEGNDWARWTLLLIAFVEGLPTLFSVLQIMNQTTGQPPLGLLILSLVGALAAFFLSADKKAV